MRPPAVRSVLHQVRAAADRASICGIFDENILLEKILHPKLTDHGFPFVEALDDLRKSSSSNKTQKLERKRAQISLKRSFSLPEPSESALELMRRPSVTTKQIEQFLTSNYTSSHPLYAVPNQLDFGIMDLVSASTPNNLRTLALFLSRYWQSGVNGSRPAISVARKHAKAVLAKSLETHPPTEHHNGGEQVGIHDMAKFETFVANFFEYMGVSRTVDDELSDLLLRLHARCGSLNETSQLIETIQNRTPLSEETLNTYLEALASSHPTPESLLRVKKLLLNDQTGPAAVKFLLPLLETSRDIVGLLSYVDRSALGPEVYQECQSHIVSRLMELNAVSILFPILQRISKHAPLSSSTIDTALVHALSGKTSSTKSTIKQLLELAPTETEVYKQAQAQL